jgi:hypothetical protein
MAGDERDLRRERAARNEALFREVNERIEDLSTSYSFTTFVCECRSEDCVEPVSISIVEYERVRGNPSHFLVLPGHVTPEAENVIEHHDGYAVVEKIGAAREVAEELDPRDDGTGESSSD